MPKLFEFIEKGDIDPSLFITHIRPLDEAPEAYEMFKNHDDECIKVVLKPGMQATAP